MNVRLGITLVFAAALALALGGASAAVSSTPDPGDQAGAPAPVHPKVEAAQDCETCHRETTPAIVERWEKSPHGKNSVKCFVCHGSLGAAEFTTRPAMSKCDSCHSEQVATMSSSLPMMQGKTCFTCHDPHALNPHAAAQGGK
jgi:predicted CXXCH cytochrome family protein